MNRRQFYVALTVMAVSGMLGGFIGNWLLHGQAAWAQETDTVKEVRAEQFVLVDSAGAPRAMLTLGTGGDPGLMLIDKAGDIRVSLGIAGGSAAIGLHDANGQPRVGMGCTNGEPEVTVTDQAGRMRMRMGMVKGEPVIALFNDASKVRTVLGVIGGEPRLGLFDDAGEERMGLGIVDGRPVTRGID